MATSILEEMWMASSTSWKDYGHTHLSFRRDVGGQLTTFWRDDGYIHRRRDL